MKTEKELREKLAEIEHEQWISWSASIVQTENISKERLERWEKLWRPYSELTENEKESDRIWADKVLSHHQAELDELVGRLEGERKDEYPTEDGIPVETYGYEATYNQALEKAIELIKGINA